jgi:PAS domain S-box-containing protein
MVPVIKRLISVSPTAFRDKKMTEGRQTCNIGTQRNFRVGKKFSAKLIISFLLAAIFLPGAVLLSLDFYSQTLIQDYHLFLSDSWGKEEKSQESRWVQVIGPLIRQKLENLANDLTTYLENHSNRNWDEISRDSRFRDLPLQHSGTLGEVFLVTFPDKRLLWYRNRAYEGQYLEQALGQELKLSRTPYLHLLDQTPHKDFKEFTLSDGQVRVVGYLKALPRPPVGGPVILAGVWVNFRELQFLAFHSQALFQQLQRWGPDGFKASLARVRLLLLPGLVALGAMFLLAGLILARQFHSRVGALSMAVQAFTRGDLSYRLRFPPQDELGELALKLNAMASAITDATVPRREWECTFNSLPDMVILVNSEGYITRLNQAAATCLNLNPKEAVGRHLKEIRPGSPDGFPAWALMRILEQGVGKPQEFCILNGQSFSITVEPVWDPQDRMLGAVIVARNLTSHRNLQQELARTREFLEKLIASAPLGMLLIGPEGAIQRCNPQFFQDFGYSTAEVLNRHYAFLFVSEAERQEVMAELKDKKAVLGHQVLLRHADGHPVPARLSLRFLEGENESHRGFVALVSNISEEVNLQRQLEQAQRQEAIATLAGGLAHNFNNLLTIILGLVTLMHGKIPPDHPAFGDLMDIERQVRAGRDITQKLLSFRRGPDFKTQALDLNRLVATTADMFGRTRPELVIRQELAANLPAVEGDPGQIQQVLMNLLINAWQSMPQGGVITLETRAVQVTDWQDRDWDIKPGSFVCLSVSDTGTGMDEKIMARLFEPFFTTKEPGQGSGLGLASAARIMKNHRGAIQVRSRPGEGSTFTLFFPASTARPRVETSEEGCVIPGQGTILVVDDDPALRRVACKLLEKLGYQVLEAPSGEGALEIYAQYREAIDLVLLDILMPGLNGLQTMERLRALDPQVKILLVSGVSDSLDDNLPPGVDFLTKPFPLGLLSQKVAAALNH